MPACAKPEPKIEAPSDLPDDLPVPPGTVFTNAQRPFEGQLVLRGVVPGKLNSAANFFRDSLPDAGYELGVGDAEPGEAESLFTGAGVRGGWRVNAIPDCDGAVRLLLVLVRQ
jgi:hypothetical protein